MMSTRTTSATIVETGVEHTSAAHLVIDDEPVTVCWSTIPTACSDYLLGDVTSQGPVHQAADQPPAVWLSSNSTYSAWQPSTEVQCGTCGRRVGPWAVVRDGHLEGDELTDVALEVAELADQEREGQRRKLIAHLTVDVEDTVRRLADGTLERSELPDVGTMVQPGIGLDGNQLVAWATLPALDGGDDPEIVEVTRPIPTTSTTLA